MKEELDFDSVFAQNVIERRTRLGWTQAQLLKKLHELGYSHLHQTTLSRIEKAAQPAKLVEAIAIASALNCNVNELLIPPNGLDEIQVFFQAVDEADFAYADLFKAASRFSMAKHFLQPMVENADNLIDQVGDADNVLKLALLELVKDDLERAKELLAVESSIETQLGDLPATIEEADAS